MEYLFAIFLHNYPNLSARRPTGYLRSNPIISGIFLKFPSVLRSQSWKSLQILCPRLLRYFDGLVWWFSPDAQHDRSTHPKGFFKLREICQTFKNTFPSGHQRTTASYPNVVHSHRWLIRNIMLCLSNFH